MENEPVITSEFKELVDEYQRIDDIRRDHLRHAADLRVPLKQLQDRIMPYMKTEKIDELASSAGVVQFKTGTKTIGLNQKWVKQRITEYFQSDQEQASSLVDFITNKKHRPKKEFQSLTRVLPESIDQV